MSELKMYMGYDSDPEQGACLVFAHSVQDARKLAYPILRNWFQTEWIHVSASLLGQHEYLREEADQEKLKAGIPHVIESPECCCCCEMWGISALDKNKRCESCEYEFIESEQP